MGAPRAWTGGGEPQGARSPTRQGSPRRSAVRSPARGEPPLSVRSLTPEQRPRGRHAPIFRPRSPRKLFAYNAVQDVTYVVEEESGGLGRHVRRYSETDEADVVPADMNEPTGGTAEGGTGFA